MILSDFNKGFLSSINSVYDDFVFLDKIKEILIFGLRSQDLNPIPIPIPLETSKVCFFYRSRFVYINLELLEKNDFAIKKKKKSISYNLGLNCASIVFADLVEQEYFPADWENRQSLTSSE